MHKNPKTSKTNKTKGGAPFGGNAIYWIYLPIAAFLLLYVFFSDDNEVETINWSSFVSEYLQEDKVEKVEYAQTDERVLSLKVFLKEKALIEKFGKDKAVAYQYKAPLETLCPSVETLQDELAKLDEQGIPKPEEEVVFSQGAFEKYFWNFLPLILLVVFFLFIMRRSSAGGGPGGVFNVGKSKAKLYDGEAPIKVNFDSVAGLAEAKEEIEEIVLFLKNPDTYTDLGGKIPKGALLVGPPGTGKTLLAKGVAGEANVPFFSMSGSDFVEMFVGVGASRVRDLFRQAKEKAPCIIFIDEIDAIGRARGERNGFGANDERENTLNQLLTEMDGFGDNSGVIILAATNRAEILDKALLRAGRFDRQIHVDLPDLNERVEIFNVHLKPLKLSPDVDPMELSRLTPGFSGADIANICNEAALIAARRKKKSIEKQDFSDAIDRVVGGLEKRNRLITKDEKHAIAIHESGHALVSWMTEHANPLVKVTIVPRGKALGAAWYAPEERYMTYQDQLLDEMCATLAGRAAEDVVFGKISTGALNDLERVTKMAYGMIKYYGMGKQLGNISFFDSTGTSNGFYQPYSDETSEAIDEEVKNLVNEQYERAKSILVDHREKLEGLAELLLQKEVIYKEDVEGILGKRPWLTRSELLSNEDKKEDQQSS